MNGKRFALFLDGIEASAVEALTEAGFEVTAAKKMDPAQLMVTIGRYHFLAVRSVTKVTAELLNAATNLLAVGRAGAGMDGIDFEAVAQLGIVAFPTPGANARSVAECALAQMLDALRRLSKGAVGLASYQWRKKECQGQALAGKTVGIYGMGFVGKWLTRFLGPHDVRLLSCDVDPAAALPWVPFVPPEQVLAESDVVSLHLPLNEGTRRLVDSSFLERMKPGAILVNSARGELVDEAAIMAALSSGHLYGYATDVYESEPPDFEKSPLFSDPALVKDGRLIMTPHLFASSDQAQAQVAEMLVEQTLRFFQQGEMPWGANFPAFILPRKGQSRLLVFHRDVVGKMDQVLAVLRGPGINVAGAINQRVEKDGPAYTVVDVDSQLTTEVIGSIKAIPGVCRVHYV